MQGGAWHRAGVPGDEGETWQWPAVVRPRSSSYWQELEEAPGGWAGLSAGWAIKGRWAAARLVPFSLSLFHFYFLPFLAFVLIWFLNQINFAASGKFYRD